MLFEAHLEVVVIATGFFAQKAGLFIYSYLEVILWENNNNNYLHAQLHPYCNQISTSV